MVVERGRTSTRKTAAKKARTRSVASKLTEEEKVCRMECDQLLETFDVQTQKRLADSRKEAKAAGDAIASWYKLELMKMPKDVKSMNWEEWVAREGEEGEGGDRRGTIANVDIQVDALRSNIKSAGSSKGRGRGKKRSVSETPDTVRRSGRARNQSGPGGERVVCSTPANRPRAHPLMTPVITPKVDIRTRTAKVEEVLYSLSGSPVAPVVGPRSKAAKIQQSKSLTVVGGGHTLNLPLGEDGKILEEGAGADLDEAQAARLEELQSSISNMLKIHREGREEQ